MPNLYKGYCYATIIDAATAEISEPIYRANVGVVSNTTFASVTSTTGNMTLTYKPLNNTGASQYVITRVYPSCSNVGYLTNYTGLDLVDAVTVSWLVVLCWSIAWGIKQMRRAL